MIRPATPADVEPLVELAAGTDVFKPIELDMLREVLDDFFAGDADPGDRCLVAFDGRIIEGFVYFGPAEMTVDTWELWWIVVRRDGQRRGIGRDLLCHAEGEANAEGGRRMFIDTSSLPVYEPTWQFYVRNGYEREAVLRDYYAPGDGKVIFRKVFA